MKRFLLSVAALLAATSWASAQNKELTELFAAEWEWKLRESPDVASILGFRRGNADWPVVTPAAFAARDRHRREVLEKLQAFDPATLSPADRENLAVFRSEYETEIEGFRHGIHLTPLNHLEGLHDLSPILDSLSFDTVRDYDDWLARLQKFPTYVDQTIELLKEGVKRNRVPPRVTIQRVPGVLRRLSAGPADQHPLTKPFRTYPADLPAADRQRLTKAAAAAISEKVIPAYKTLLTFVEGEYLPACYDGVGVWHLNGGADVYAFQVRNHTTTKLTPDEIHEMGLKEVARIRGEMDAVIKKVGFKGTFAEFLEFLRTDKQFYHTDSEALLAEARAICKTLEVKLPGLFGKLPKTRFAVEPVPPFMGADAAGGYYLWPSADGRRPGTYYINTYKPEERPRFVLEALSLHEAVPGHHLQIALAFEREGVPAFRRYSFGYNAYVEGWALYSESLGEQLGAYRDPYSKFGQLSYEIWRAVRLVVDTGMHHKKWPRQRAIDYALANSAESRLETENEIDRYAAWPGQALSYKLGELKIKELRARAERELGPKFDIRGFHDTVLATGPVPLDALEAAVMAWVKQR